MNRKNSAVRIAVLASGNGSNAQRLAEYFAGNRDISIPLIISNKKDAYVHERAKGLGIPSYCFSRAQFSEVDEVLDLLKEYRIDVIVLAGFLLLVPEKIIKAFPDRVVNIHPALLPKYGGKGMYGHHVHEAVIAAGEQESGITIHLVNEKYDDGRYLFQARCTLTPEDTPETLAQKIHLLEYEHFPKVVEQLSLGLNA